jgi:hypothetical protein
MNTNLLRELEYATWKVQVINLPEGNQYHVVNESNDKIAVCYDINHAYLIARLPTLYKIVEVLTN